MEKEFVPYEQALDLKELGFDEPCFAFRTKNNHQLRFGEGFELVTREPYRNVMRYPLVNSRYEAGNNAPDGYYYLTTIPTFSQAFRWFREKYDLVSWVRRRPGFVKEYSWYVSDFNDEDPDEYYFDLHIETYEEAELACLKKLIEIVKEK